MAKVRFTLGTVTGKVGDLTYTKWKDKKVVKTVADFSKNRTLTYTQRYVNTWFGNIGKYVNYLNGLSKYSALDTSGMTWANRVIKLNKATIGTTVFYPGTLLVSQGSLASPANFTAEIIDTAEKAKVYNLPSDYNPEDSAQDATPMYYVGYKFDVPQSSMFTENAKIICAALQPLSEGGVIVDIVNNYLSENALWVGNATSVAKFRVPSATEPILCYAYTYDKDGSTKRASTSVTYTLDNLVLSNLPGSDSAGVPVTDDDDSETSQYLTLDENAEIAFDGADMPEWVSSDTEEGLGAEVYEYAQGEISGDAVAIWYAEEAPTSAGELCAIVANPTSNGKVQFVYLVYTGVDEPAEYIDLRYQTKSRRDIILGLTYLETDNQISGALATYFTYNSVRHNVDMELTGVTDDLSDNIVSSVTLTVDSVTDDSASNGGSGGTGGGSSGEEPGGSGGGSTGGEDSGSGT